MIKFFVFFVVIGLTFLTCVEVAFHVLHKEEIPIEFKVDKDKLLHLLSSLSKNELSSMREAGLKMKQWQTILSMTASNVSLDVIREKTLKQFTHYPQGDVLDEQSQYYYHTHRTGERGHFHLFFLIPSEKTFTHLFAISLDSDGNPLKIFTTNLWVTGGKWCSASELDAMVEKFHIAHAYPSFPTNQWINQFLRFFLPQIRELLRERDFHMAQRSSAEVHRDRSLEIISTIPLSFDLQMELIEKLLQG